MLAIPCCSIAASWGRLEHADEDICDRDFEWRVDNTREETIASFLVPSYFYKNMTT
jgi:hypothetical protein